MPPDSTTELRPLSWPRGGGGEKTGARPLAKVVGYTQAAVSPKELFIAPARALPRLLKKLGWRFADVDLIELNEAFAAQVLADGYAMLEDGWDWDWGKG